MKTKRPYISDIIPRKFFFSSILAALSSVFFLGELIYLGLTSPGYSPCSSSASRGFSGESSVTYLSYEKYSVSHLSSSNLRSLGIDYTSMSKSLKYFTFGNLILQTSLLGYDPNSYYLMLASTIWVFLRPMTQVLYQIVSSSLSKTMTEYLPGLTL